MVEKKTKKETSAKKESKKAAAAQAAAAPAASVSPAEPQKEARVGVFTCHCGTNIAGSIDINAVQEYASTLPGVAFVDNY